MNGSFEEFGMQTPPGVNSFTAYSTLPGWTSEDSIEIHYTGFIADAQDGTYYAELNADPAQATPFALTQTFDTNGITAFTLSFWAQARLSNDGSFFVSAGDDVVMEEISSHVVGSWTEYVLNFAVAGPQATITFLSGQSGKDTVGHFLDNISVKPVPLPGALVMLAGGILGLGLFRRREA